MRQSLDEFEQAFHAEVDGDRARREALRRQAAQRARQRDLQDVAKRSTLRFALLVLTLLATAIAVTVLMFETLYLVMG